MRQRIEDQTFQKDHNVALVPGLQNVGSANIPEPERGSPVGEKTRTCSRVQTIELDLSRRGHG